MSDIKVTTTDGRAERAAPEPLPRLPRRAAVSRHGAISRELTKYASYKSWADKARGAFAAEPAESGTAGGPTPSRRSTDR